MEDITLVPDVIAALCDCQGFVVIRIKNRLDPDHEAVDTAGYRDVQILVREPRGGWIVEVQVIPKEMYTLKTSNGHAGYTKYRFILETCKRAKVALQKQATAADDAQAGHTSEAAGDPIESLYVQPVKERVLPELRREPFPLVLEPLETLGPVAAGGKKAKPSRNAVHPI